MTIRVEMKLLKLKLFFTAFTMLLLNNAIASIGTPKHTYNYYVPSAVEIVGKETATIYVDKNAEKGVLRAVQDLRRDIKAVTGKRLEIVHEITDISGQAIIIGNIATDPVLSELQTGNKADFSAIKGQWDSFTLQTVNIPQADISKALVIAGSNKRGVIYGIYDVSLQAGVSPWYYWADVPIKQSKTLYSKIDKPIVEIPKVKYRGIFLNDEAPALSNWTQKNHGGYNHKFYVKVFELLLRLKGNYLWPAMWNNAFADDDAQNMILADEYGIVMGTSHHEPMMRADKEWDRDGEGEWRYSTNAENLKDFWVRGVKRNAPYESLYTMGMRGREDKAMEEGENIALLERIVADQRKILQNHITDRELDEIPQVWCLYKEVQAYYEKGMRVPDDITLLWADDNWGNIRRLPTQDEQSRAGGAGVYYHFDYVGGPRSYRWINTVPITKIWEQMHQAYAYNANKIWITNVGDLKPMEFPIEFFLSMAWDPEDFNRSNLSEYGIAWAEREFGAKYASQINSLIEGYTRHNGRRKPELMSPDTYNLMHYNEANRVEQELTEMVTMAERIYQEIEQSKKDAFFQLVLHPVKASANLTKLYIATAKNRLYAAQGRSYTDEYRLLAKKLFKLDADLKQQYDQLNGGKWQHFMDKAYIGYESWNAPPVNTMPVLHEYQPHEGAEMGLQVEGEPTAFPAKSWFSLKFDSLGQQERTIEIFNRGSKAFSFKVNTSDDWLKISEMSGKVLNLKELKIAIDWSKLKAGNHKGNVQIRGTSYQRANISVEVTKIEEHIKNTAKGFVESDGYISINAANFSHNQGARGHRWQVIEGLGRTRDSSTIAVFPKTYVSFEVDEPHPVVEYNVSFTSSGTFPIEVYTLPTLKMFPNKKMRLGISLNDQPIQVIDLSLKAKGNVWADAVRNSVNKAISQLKVKTPGNYKLKLHMFDPGLGIEKIQIDTGGLKPSYLGPPQSVKL